MPRLYVNDPLQKGTCSVFSDLGAAMMPNMYRQVLLQWTNECGTFFEFHSSSRKITGEYLQTAPYWLTTS